MALKVPDDIKFSLAIAAVVGMALSGPTVFNTIFAGGMSGLLGHGIYDCFDPLEPATG